MINCRNCVHWIDESLREIEADRGGSPHIFMGCRIFGHVEKNTALPSCGHYLQSENAFTLCTECGIRVPKVCVSLGQCVNCTDTDLFCVDHCTGGDARAECAHFLRLHTEGVHLAADGQVFELFPSIGMPGRNSSPPDKKSG